MVEFSQRLKQLRKDKHLTQAQVAKRIGYGLVLRDGHPSALL